MILKYKVSLPGIKGFARVYEVRPTTSLYSFHKQMRSDMDFPQDQPVLFKAVDPDGKAVSRYASVDLGCGTIDEITVGQCHKAGEDSFVYFYDTTNVKSVLVDFLEEADRGSGVVYPFLLEAKGPNPVDFENGYVAFDDLPADKKKNPDDWDDDDEDEELEDENLDVDDADDEDGQEVFSEDE